MRKIIALTIGLIIFLSSSLTVSAATWSCETVNTASAGIYVILEEPLIAKADEDDNNKLCFRVCEKTPTEGKRICQIKKTCSQITGSKSSDIICQRIQIVRAETGTGLLYNYIGLIYKWAASTIGIIAVFTIVYSGILIIASGGSSEAVTKAKERITRSLLGLVVLFLSGLILYTINPTFFV